MWKGQSIRLNKSGAPDARALQYQRTSTRDNGKDETGPRRAHLGTRRDKPDHTRPKQEARDPREEKTGETTGGHAS